MTYTLLGRCARTGAIGVGIATYSLAVGASAPQVVRGKGAVASQAWANPQLRTLGASLLDLGHTAPHALALLVASDLKIGFRQVAVLDRRGDGACHTGPSCRAWAGHRIGTDYVACGNVLAGPGVVDAIAEAFEKSEGMDLAERLLRGMEAGRDAGGQVGGNGHLPERSAALIVYGQEEHAQNDLRIDMHDDAVTALRALFTTYAPYIAYRRQRWRNPEVALPQEQFVASLKG
ncbi:DUF1028 domain-containing protein [Falsiroseomonas sp. HW251]|uniref:DUF1028 domain-containing protein n=1 Tax=Falsiroseomonas sp. HW251 TaxID=3390998 RepID=UPI003D31EFE7